MYDHAGYELVGDFRVCDDADKLPDHRVCQVCRDDRHVLAPATHLGPSREDTTDLLSRITYMPVCKSHAASWLSGADHLDLGPMMQLPTADFEEGKE